MALPAFDAEKHHVGLGGFGFILDGAYRKHEQSEGTPSEFGGDRDLVAEPGLARWTQDSFVGGQYQYTWDDPAMIRSCKGMMPSVYEDSLRSVPYFCQALPFNVNGEVPFGWWPVTGCFVVAYPSGIKLIIPDTGEVLETETYLTNAGTLSGSYVNINLTFHKVMGWDPTTFMLYVVYKAYFVNSPATTNTTFGPPGTHIIVRYHIAPGAAVGSKISIVPSTDPGGGIVNAWETPDDLKFNTAPTPSDMSWTREPMHVSFGQGGSTWTFLGYTANLLRPFNGNAGVNGTSTYWVLEQTTLLPSAVVDIFQYNGLQYILCSDTSQWVTQLFSFDGTTLHLVIEFPYSFQARCITQYGGRLFVGGASRGPDNASDIFGELYEISGETLRLVRTFAPEYRNSDVPNSAPSAINALAVFEGLLWFHNPTTHHFEAYDLARDAFYGGPRLGESDNDPSDWTITEMRAYRDSLYFFLNDANNPARNGFWRIGATGVAEGSEPPEWEMVTSDFIAEPARDKAFSTLKILTRYGGVDSAEYSTDGGLTFAALTETDTETSGTLVTTTYDASAIKARQVCFRFRGTRGTVGAPEFDGYTEIIAFTVSFQFLDTGFLVWQLTVQGAEQTELLDGSKLTQDVSEIAEQLWEWKQEGTKLSYVDLDGVTRNVRIVDVSEQMPYIGPRLPDEGRPEAFFTLTLAEV